MPVRVCLVGFGLKMQVECVSSLHPLLDNGARVCAVEGKSLLMLQLCYQCES